MLMMAQRAPESLAHSIDKVTLHSMAQFDLHENGWEMPEFFTGITWAAMAAAGDGTHSTAGYLLMAFPELMAPGGIRVDGIRALFANPASMAREFTMRLRILEARSPHGNPTAADKIEGEPTMLSRVCQNGGCAPYLVRTVGSCSRRPLWSASRRSARLWTPTTRAGLPRSRCYEESSAG